MDEDLAVTEGKELVDKKGTCSDKQGLESWKPEPSEHVSRGLRLFKMSPDRWDRVGASLQPEKISSPFSSQSG